MIYKSYLVEKNINLLEKKIILFYGENFGQKNDLKNEIKKNIRKAEIVHFNQEDLIKNEELFFNEIQNISLFNEEKIFFINQANDKILDLIKEIETKIDTQKIFLFCELLEKKSKIRNYFEKSDNLGIVPCYADNEITLKKIILERLKGFSGLSSQTLNIIIENCGLDRGKLNNELSKIISFFDTKQIDEGKLEGLLNTKENDKFEVLKDQALIGNKIKTNKLISDTILEPDKNILYLNLINQRLIKLLEICETESGNNIDDAISKIKPPVFWKDKPIFSLQAKKWDKDKIKKILAKTFNLEIRIKSNSLINQQLLIKKLLVDVCVLANAS
jgi:DNA polymerase-3 subunit delta